MSARSRWAVLGSLLIASLVLRASEGWTSRPQEVVVAAVAPRQSAPLIAASGQTTPVGESKDVERHARPGNWRTIRVRPLMDEVAGDPFASDSSPVTEMPAAVEPAPEPPASPVPRRKRSRVPPPVAAAPATPVSAPPPTSLLGHYASGSEFWVFIASPGGTIGRRLGDTIDGGWTLSRIEGRQLVLTHAATGQSHAVDLGYPIATDAGRPGTPVPGHALTAQSDAKP